MTGEAFQLAAQLVTRMLTGMPASLRQPDFAR
jgi:hypothetical protein